MCGKWWNSLKMFQSCCNKHKNVLFFLLFLMTLISQIADNCLEGFLPKVCLSRKQNSCLYSRNLCSGMLLNFSCLIFAALSLYWFLILFPLPLLCGLVIIEHRESQIGFFFFFSSLLELCCLVRFPFVNWMKFDRWLGWNFCQKYCLFIYYHLKLWLFFLSVPVGVTVTDT